jgi:hypothetical protein
MDRHIKRRIILLKNHFGIKSMNKMNSKLNPEDASLGLKEASLCHKEGKSRNPLHSYSSLSGKENHQNVNN